VRLDLCVSAQGLLVVGEIVDGIGMRVVSECITIGNDHGLLYAPVFKGLHGASAAVTMDHSA
jgi:hypothetical protein